MLTKPISNIFFTAFDFETTGLYPDKDRIIEIGAVKFNLEGKEFRFSGLINPGFSIPPQASAVNGISDDMVAAMPPEKDIIPGFLSFIEDSVLIAHNIGFDASFLVQTDERLSLETPDLICLDTIIFAKKYFPGLYSYSLENICRNVGIQIENAHRAEDDAAACMDLFKKCLAKIPNHEYMDLKMLMKHSGTRKKSLKQNYSTGR